MDLANIICSCVLFLSNFGLLLCGERVKECTKRKKERKEPYDDLFKEL